MIIPFNKILNRNDIRFVNQPFLYLNLKNISFLYKDPSKFSSEKVIIDNIHVLQRLYIYIYIYYNDYFIYVNVLNMSLAKKQKHKYILVMTLYMLMF